MKKPKSHVHKRNTLSDLVKKTGGLQPTYDKHFLLSLTEDPTPVIQLHKKVGGCLSPEDEKEALAIIKKHANEPDVSDVVPSCFRPKMARAKAYNEKEKRWEWIPVLRRKGTHINTRHRNKIPADDRERKATLKASRSAQHLANSRPCHKHIHEGGAV